MPNKKMSNKKNMQVLAETLSRKTKFDKNEIEVLLLMFYALAGDKQEKVDRTKFRDVLHNQFEITDDIIMDRVFKAFDKDNDGLISAEEWVKGLSIYLRGTSDERIRFCFDVFDMNADGHISRDEMFQLLKTCIIKQTSDEDPDEGVKDLVDLLVKKMDKDHDGRLSYADYNRTVQECPLLLEAFGSCLPCDKKVQDFSQNFSDPDEREAFIKSVCQ